MNQNDIEKAVEHLKKLTAEGGKRMRLSMEEVQKQHESTKKLYEQGLTVAPVDVKRVLDLYDTIEVLQQENEQLQAQNAAMREALEWAGSALGQSPCLCRADSECMRCQALTAIDKAGGGGV